MANMAEKTKEKQKGVPAPVIILGALATGLIILVSRGAKAAGTATLRGVVRDNSTGAVLPDVLVTVDGKTTTTDSQGTYKFTGLAAGVYTITFSKTGYDTVTAHDVNLVKGDNQLNVYLNPTGVPPTTASLFGVVTDIQTGAPIPEAVVTVDSSIVQTTDSSGFYQFTELTPGSHEVKFEKTGYNTEVR